MLKIVGDVLDKPVIDRSGRPMGRADGITMSVRDGQPPRLEAVLLGRAALAERVSLRLARWMEWWERRLGLPGERSVAVPFARIVVKPLHLEADVAAGDTGLVAFEQRLQRWIARIPGS